MAGWPTISAIQPPAANDALHQTQPFCSQGDVAYRLGVCVATIARARKKQSLIGHRIEGQWRFTEQQITDYLELTKKPLRLCGRRLNDTTRHDASLEHHPVKRRVIFAMLRMMLHRQVAFEGLVGASDVRLEEVSPVISQASQSVGGSNAQPALLQLLWNG